MFADTNYAQYYARVMYTFLLETLANWVMVQVSCTVGFVVCTLDKHLFTSESIAEVADQPAAK